MMMMAKCVFGYFVVLVIAVLNIECSATEDADRQRDINDPQPFRLNKLNMMWDKAKQVNAAFHFRYFAIWHSSRFCLMRHFAAVELEFRTCPYLSPTVPHIHKCMCIQFPGYVCVSSFLGAITYNAPSIT